MYVDVESFDIARGELGYIMEFEEKVDTQVFPDDTITGQLGTLDMAFLDPSQVNDFFILLDIYPCFYV